MGKNFQETMTSIHAFFGFTKQRGADSTNIGHVLEAVASKFVGVQAESLVANRKKTRARMNEHIKKIKELLVAARLEG